MALFYSSPLGWLKLEATEKGLSSLIFVEKPSEKGTITPFLENAATQLKEYFEGNRKVFEIDLDFSKGTPFEQAVWQQIRTVPFGKTTTYAKLATAIGKSKGASQAVGSAVGRNPIGIIIPCHRIIGTDGQLRGFAWGLDKKATLLSIEGVGVKMQGNFF